MADNLLVGITSNGDTAPIRTSEKPGGHVQHTFPADPADGSAIKAASQADVQAVADALAALATAAKQDAAQVSLAAIVAALAPLATAAGVAEVRDRLPATAHAQPLTDAQLRAAPLPLPVGAATEAALDGIANLLALIADLLPRLTSNKQAAVAIESGSVGIASAQTLATVTTVGTLNAVGGQFVNGLALNAAGLPILYDRLEIT